MTKYSAPEHHHFFFFAVLETFFFCEQAIHHHTQLAYCSQPEPFRQRPGLVAGQSASQTRPTVSSGDPHFHARARSRAPQFHAQTCSGAPIFHFAAGHTYQNLGWVPPSPPPPPASSPTTNLFNGNKPESNRQIMLKLPYRLQNLHIEYCMAKRRLVKKKPC